MMLLIASAAAIEPSWDCDSTASYPTLESMRGAYDDLMADPSLGVIGTFNAWLVSQRDDSCVPTDCAYTDDEREGMDLDDVQECERYACVTAEGAAIAYKDETWDRAYSVGWEIEEQIEEWSVSLGDGTRVVFKRYRLDAFDIGWPGAWEASDSWSIVWTGSPIETLPADTSATGRSGQSEDYFGWAVTSAQWATDGCTVYAASDSFGGFTDRGFAAATANGVVNADAAGCAAGSYQGWLDGVLVGAVDGTTWALSTSDGDADGVEAAHDCDDTDATISPCAEEIPGDGIDQDCDWADG